MALPNVQIVYGNGALGTVVPSADGLFGLVVNVDSTNTTFNLTTPYLISSMADIEALGITDNVENHRFYKFLSEFYAEAGTGTALYVYGIPRQISMSTAFTQTQGASMVKSFLDGANGEIRGLFTVYNPTDDYVPVIEDGLDKEVPILKDKAQLLADDYTATKQAPFFVVIEGYAYNGTPADLPDLTMDSCDRVGIVIGDTENRNGPTLSNGAALGVLAGRLAKNQVHVNPGKVRDGKLAVPKMYVVNSDVKVANISPIHDKGYITFRSHIGKTGVFVTDDPLACEITNDYRQLTHRRTIDKAYRIAYTTLLEFLLDDVQLTNTGTISPVYAKTVEGQVIAAIQAQMTYNGELSVDETDKNDTGVICKVDLTEVSAQTSKLKLSTLQVRPKGHNRFIEVPLGFIPITN